MKNETEVNKLVNENIKIIYKIATMFYGAEKDDLIQAGKLGILKAYKTFDETKGAKFSTFAYISVFGEMYAAATKKNLKVNKDTLKLYKHIEKRRYEEAQNLGYIPSNYELSKIMNISIEMIDFAMNAMQSMLYFDAENENERSLYETIASSSNIAVDDRILLESGFEYLSENEKIILKERYFADETQANVARKLKMTQVMVSRLEKKGLNKMKDYMEVSV